MTFATITIHSNKGDFIFTFKHDRRTKRRLGDAILFIKTFIVEIKLPDGLETKVINLESTVMLVLTLAMNTVDYEILAEALLETYAEKFDTSLLT
jgi:hypothetical protein